MRTLLLVLFFFPVTFSLAQKGNYAAYTVNEGLPSNHVYQCTEDNHGFLWVATDAGIARFDGRFFQVFTTKNGLPDNEVLQVVKDGEGTIWINCFRQSPAYFDETKNRFINATEDSNLAKVTGTANMYVYTLDDGGVMYTNEKGSFIFRKKKPAYFTYVLLKENKDGSYLSWDFKRATSTQKKKAAVLHISKGDTVDRVDMSDDLTVSPNIILRGNNIYMFDPNNRTMLEISEITTGPLRFKKTLLKLPESYFFAGITNNMFYVISNTASIYAYSKDDFNRSEIYSGDYIPNGYYKDSKENVWIPTVDKGLLVYRKKQLPTIELPANFTRTNFLSVTRENNGRLLAGNYYGEVIEMKGNQTAVHKVIKKNPSRQRKILVKGKDIYTISEDGIFKNFTIPVQNVDGGQAAGKTAMLYNDTTILLGGFAGVAIVNTTLNKVARFERYKRVTAITMGLKDEIYVGSTDGLYKYDPRTRVNTPLNNVVNDRVTGLYLSPDKLLWVATSGSGIIVLKDEKPIAMLSENEGIINNSCRSIAGGKAQQVWLGTSQGISIINYQLNNSKLNFTIENISVNDGLASNEINEMSFSNDTMFVATSNGITAVPANLSQPSFNIPVRITSISINQRDTIITDSYQLGTAQQNIQMQFGAIEINGHFKYLEYTLNGKDWTYLSGRTLTLQLNSGKHVLQVRAVDVHGHISNKILTINFDIATPFWKTFWFWIVIALLFQALILYFVNRWQKARKEKRLSKEMNAIHTASLEQQAFTSLMNPHFIFNALNSIQHYINLQDRQKANRYLSDFASLIRKNFEASQRSFISLEQELDNMRIYLRLEQMRFAERFAYVIHLDDHIDTEKWMIPTMMLQPLLENAILHGLMPSANKGELQIHFCESEGSLVINITDNGIGVQNSLSAKQNNDHKSHGMELIRKRIKALGNLSGSPITINTSVAFESNTNPGTRIILVIPSDLYDAWLRASSNN